MEHGVLLRVSNASFGYGGPPVVRGASFEVRAGACVGVVGPNGAGKSTLLKGLLGLLPSMDGEVEYAAGVRAHVGYVPQRETLDPIYPLTALDVVRMGLGAARPWWRRACSEDKSRALACIERVGLGPHAEEPFAELSGGQRQRALIARALVAEPRLLVLDEPTAGVDPAAEHAIIALLGRLNREERLTTLMVSHHLHVLREFATHGVFVNEESVLAGTAAEIFSHERLGALLERGL